eukprot:TRINITY_DN2284_c0_g1_i3.p1 TRINITY_DN2284_c0_g1~~TRINITY_DN2284_c0_g1_i3.p1  ORF type:complete len:134 (+),score=50.84 TRINITY_DN2284_c0_g1_i3:46-402(+)
MVSQYTKFLDMERVTQTHSAYFNNVVDTLLVRLEELNNLIEMIKEDGITTQKEYLPVLVQKANEVNETFELIDKLSETIDRMEAAVDQLDDRISTTERNYNMLTIKKKFQGIGNFFTK